MWRGEGAELLRSVLRTAGARRATNGNVDDEDRVRGSCGVAAPSQLVPSWIFPLKMPIEKYANMEEKLWILEDLNMMYIRQIALSLQVKVSSTCL